MALGITLSRTYELMPTSYGASINFSLSTFFEISPFVRSKNSKLTLPSCMFFFLLLHNFINICNTVICKYCKIESHNVVTKFPVTISPRHKSFGATHLLQSLTYNCQSAWHRLQSCLWLGINVRGESVPSMVIAEISYSKVKYG